ncbi:hypothetical protein Z962_11350 [Clostridium botulinum C/D str. BKT12695]|nr:hypothetical protein Z962_11350 [Clostridium botulinum C/D str. BKT12695]
MLDVVKQFKTKQGKWSKYNHLDFFTRGAKCREEANKVDLTKVNLNAKGQALIAEIENMCCFPIIQEEDFLEIWEYNGWTMEKWLKDHMERKDRKFYNPWQTVCSRCN